MALKKPSPKQAGLKKLPTTVRNKMGYMNKGGMVENKKEKIVWQKAYNIILKMGESIMGVLIKCLMVPYTLVKRILKVLKPWFTLKILRRQQKKELNVPNYMAGKKKNNG